MTPHNGRVTTKKVGSAVTNLLPESVGDSSPTLGVIRNRADEKVFIGFSRPSNPPAKFYESLLGLYRLDTLGAVTPDGKSVGAHGRIWNGGAQGAIEAGAEITRTRNRIVSEFLAIERPIDWLWMVDADMTFESDILERLITAAHPKLRPVVGGLCFAWMADSPFGRKIWPTLYAYVEGSNRLRRLTTYPPDTLIPVAGTGAACVLIHRSVLEAMAAQWARWHPPRTFYAATPFCDLGEDGGPDWRTGDEYSEDLTWCLRAEALGFPIHVHTGIKLGHVKEIVVTEEMFLAEAAVIQQACVPALPTYAVIASKDRPEMLRTLVSQLRPQVTDIFVMDNGCDEKVCEAWVHWVPCRGWDLTAMWNEGLRLVKEAAAEVVGGGTGKPYNLLVINDDVEVPSDFVARLETGLRCHDDHWIAYPNYRGVELPPEGFGRTQSESMAGQTMSGFAFMVRGEVDLTFDPRFKWWYADSDIERQVREVGKFTVCVNTAVRHLEPLKSTMDDPERLAQAEADEALYAEKWGLDPSTLWLAQHKAGAE